MHSALLPFKIYFIYIWIHTLFPVLTRNAPNSGEVAREDLFWFWKNIQGIRMFCCTSVMLIILDAVYQIISIINKYNMPCILMA